MPKNRKNPLLQFCGTQCGSVAEFLDEAEGLITSEEELAAAFEADGMAPDAAAAEARESIQKNKREYMLSLPPKGRC